LTLVLAIALNDCAVLAADRRIAFGPVGGPYQQAEADKLFNVRGCAVAAFGSSPAGIDVPSLVRSTNSTVPASPKQLAELLCERVQLLSERGTFGLLVLGECGSGFELYEVVSVTASTTQLQSGVLHARGVTHCAVLPSASCISELRERFLTLFRQAAMQFSSVGPPFEFATFARGSSAALERSDD
jgi:hypothetical protein